MRLPVFIWNLMIDWSHRGWRGTQWYTIILRLGMLWQIYGTRDSLYVANINNIEFLWFRRDDEECQNIYYTLMRLFLISNTTCIYFILVMKHTLSSKQSSSLTIHVVPTIILQILCSSSSIERACESLIIVYQMFVIKIIITNGPWLPYFSLKRTLFLWENVDNCAYAVQYYRVNSFNANTKI